MALSRKIAYVNLSKGDVRTSPIPMGLRRQYLGGRALNTYLLFNHARPGADALGAESILVVGAGLLCGTPAPAAAMTTLTARSPLTGLVAHSQHGGHFAGELRWAGFDHIVIRGKAKKPVTIHVEDGVIEIRDAASLRGLDTVATREAIRLNRADPELQALSIGPAGESLVRFACAHTDFGHGAHRGGLGAVMGGKNLKAISVRGGGRLELKNPGEAGRAFGHACRQARETTFGRHFSGGGSFWLFNHIENLWRNRHLDDRRFLLRGAFDEPRIRERQTGTTACQACPLGCRMAFRVPDGPNEGRRGEGPDFWALAAFGPMLGSRDLNGVLAAVDLCTRHGLDPLETAGLLAWTLKLAESGIIDEKTTNGRVLAFGDTDGILSVVEDIAQARGLGAKLAMGGLSAAEAFGQGAEDLLPQIKGMVSSPLDDRGIPGFALAAAVSSMGADHRAAPWLELWGLDAETAAFDSPVSWEGEIDPAPFAWEGRARMVQWNENAVMAADTLGLCSYVGPLFDAGMPGFASWAELVSSATSLAPGARGVWDAAERGVHLERLFNLREGMTAAADSLPAFHHVHPKRRRRKKGERIPFLDEKEFRSLVNTYYGLRGWDGRGRPKVATLSALGLEKEPTYML